VKKTETLFLNFFLISFTYHPLTFFEAVQFLGSLGSAANCAPDCFENPSKTDQLGVEENCPTEKLPLTMFTPKFV